MTGSYLNYYFAADGGVSSDSHCDSLSKTSQQRSITNSASACLVMALAILSEGSVCPGGSVALDKAFAQSSAKNSKSTPTADSVTE